MAEPVGFIGGGQMATALAGGAVESGFLKESDLYFVQPSSSTRETLKKRFPKATLASTPEVLLENCSRVVLAVKPHILRAISSDLRPMLSSKHLLVSIAAGLSLEELATKLGSPRVIRVMPNTPCLVGEGASAIAAGEGASEQDRVWVNDLMRSVGMVEYVEDEQIHAITGVAGSSPAYIYMVIEALSDGGVAQGLSRPVATKMAAQAVLGAAKMVLDTGLHPGALKDQVTSPGGTTIAAIRSLEADGVRSAFMEAVATCADRSRELS